jgi:hypothetical protein
MTFEQLQRAITASPFKPFTLHLADGRALLVPHPEFIAHPPNAGIAIVMREDESYTVVDIMHVTMLDFNGQTSAGSSKTGGRE